MANTIGVVGRDGYYERVESRFQGRYHQLKEDFLQYKKNAADRLEQQIKEHDEINLMKIQDLIEQNTLLADDLQKLTNEILRLSSEK